MKVRLFFYLSVNPFAFKNLQVELNQYFDALSLSAPTKVAFLKVRRKLKLEFFEHFFSVLVEQFYQKAPVKRFKGYRLWVCDGSVVKLPDNANTQTIGTHKNQHRTVVSVKLLCYFDLLNKLISSEWLKDKCMGEIRLVEPYIQVLPKDGFAFHL